MRPRRWVGDAASNVWAVGVYRVGKALQTLTLHFNGDRRSHVESAHPGKDSELNAVDVAGPRATWAVGVYARTGTQALHERWDGHSWIAN
jgi:hypothetical protein